MEHSLLLPSSHSLFPPNPHDLFLHCRIDFSASDVNDSNDVFSPSSPHSQTQRNWLCTVNESFPAGTLFSPDTLTTVPQCVAVSHAGWTLFRCDACAAL